mmetsp:Transcript_24185/g.50275  ORF Transcript_24185/g.50275 Transcript_24185/m.50275 type:complete len:106 (-) Transcript_24185:937-1254(-)
MIRSRGGLVSRGCPDNDPSVSMQRVMTTPRYFSITACDMTSGSKALVSTDLHRAHNNPVGCPFFTFLALPDSSPERPFPVAKRQILVRVHGHSMDPTDRRSTPTY